MGFIPSIKAARIGKKVFRPLKGRNSEGGNPKRKEGAIYGIRKSIRKARGTARTKASDRAAIFEPGKFGFLVDSASEKKIRGREGMSPTTPRPAGAEQRLLESFRMRKNVEWKECWKRSESSKFPDGSEEELGEVFALSRILLMNIVGHVNDQLIRDDPLLERALGEVHKRLPLPVRLVLPKKRYIELLMANRERLLP